MEPSQPSNNNSARTLLLVVGFVIGAASLYVIISAFITFETTGLLKVSSSETDATLSIAQADSQARFIGVGIAKVRLKPGEYLVSSSGKGRQSALVVQISKKQTQTITLNPDSVPLLPSVQSIKFVGINNFIEEGLTVGQINLLRQEFFDYKPKAKTITIDPGSIKPGPHNPDVDVGFKTNFTVKIDSDSFNATISYIGLDDMRLYLSNSQTGSQVYDTGVVSDLVVH